MDTEKKIYSYDELKEILRLHAMWLRSEKGGSRADLCGADLRGADLFGANLSRADLSRANLCGANLSRADLSRANLFGADLSRADLSRADLFGANLSRANLFGADLSRANLCGANLRGADLFGADLQHIKNDLIASILKLPGEIDFLRQALIEGRIDGTTYEGECACLAGTMAHACKMEWPDFKMQAPMPIDCCSPRERWFLNINPGHTPENSEVARITLEWIDEAIAMREHIRGKVAA